VKRIAGFALLTVAGLLAIAGALVATQLLAAPSDLPDSLLWKLIGVAAVLAGLYGSYLLAARAVEATAPTKVRAHTSSRRCASASSSPSSSRYSHS
jgi:hypothetical protein